MLIRRAPSFVRASRRLWIVRNVDGNGSVSSQQIEIAGLFETLGCACDSLVLQFDLALAALVVPGTNIVVIDSQGQNHVVQGGDVEGKGLVPDGIDVAFFHGGLLVSVVLITDLWEQKSDGTRTANNSIRVVRNRWVIHSVHTFLRALVSPSPNSVIVAGTYEVVLFEFEFDVGIRLSDEILIGEVVSFDEFDGENAHG